LQTVLEVKNLCFGYTKNKQLFNDFSLSLKKGEIKVVVGESGSGKSTLFELILGNLKPTYGTVHVDGKIAEVFQDPYTSFHPSYTVLNQIADVADTEHIKSYLEPLSLEYELLLQLPHKLSGGQLQRASILRAMLMKPQLLLLDEPTSALDNIVQLDVMKKLLKTMNDQAILMITHDKDLAFWCADEIVQIKI